MARVGARAGKDQAGDAVVLEMAELSALDELFTKMLRGGDCSTMLRAPALRSVMNKVRQAREGSA